MWEGEWKGGPEGNGAQLFQRGQYQDALKAFTACLNGLSSSSTATTFKIHVLFNRSACYLKLKQFEKVVEDCNTILSLESQNSKALGRKIKALCSLGNFSQAQSIAHQWIASDPENTQAKKELERLDIIVKALNDQDGEEDAIEIASVMGSGERIPPDGQEDSATTNSPSNNLTTPSTTAPTSTKPAMVTATTDTTTSTTATLTKSVQVVASSNNLPSMADLKRQVRAAEERKKQTSASSPSHNKSQSPSPGSVSNGNDDGIRSKEGSPIKIADPSSPSVPAAVERSVSHSPKPTYSSKVKGCTGEVKAPAKTSDEQPQVSQSPTRQPPGTDTGKVSSGQTSEPASTESVAKAPASKEKEAGADGQKQWKFRAPPRGLTAQEYSKCPRNFGAGSCRFGDQCSQAHSEAELQEWRDRFEERRQQMKAARAKDPNGSSYAEQLMEKWISAKNPQAVMTENQEGINIHCSSDLTITTSSKRCGHGWLFTVTSRVCLHKVALLDDANRDHFYISMITVGPKRSQKTQKVEDKCQEWTNPSFVAGKTNNEKVYRIRIQFDTEIYGTFRQSLVFDLGEEPVLVRHLCVDSSPVTDLDKLHMDLLLSEQGRWDLANIHKVAFEPKLQASDSDEEALLAKFPPPMATKFTVSPTLLQPNLTRENYRTRMHHLLYIEEMAQYSSIAKYNVKSALQLVDRFMLMPSTVSTAKFAQNGELFAKLRLNSDLSEDTSHGRLILQNINTVYVAPYNSLKQEESPSKIYEALVEERGKNFIFLRLSKTCVEELHLLVDTDFNAQVQFQLNRLPLCEMHLAVDLLPDLSLIFPSTDHSPHIPWNPTRQWSQELDSRLNPKQKEAVVAITTDLSIKLLPILIVGPYGTGKTFTLARATLEILKEENTRVLICTHSNSAADLYIRDYLHPSVDAGRTEATPLRVYYRYRWVQTVSPVIRQYCLIEEGPHGSSFRVPTKADIEKHRVVVTSLGTSRYLHNLGLEQGFFTHILLDEAAQAMECETILPLALAGEHTRIVLAGDHMQLSPEVHSEFARDRNLHMSFLERMYELYPPGNQCHILLCENYRSHKAIIDFTSELFYGNKLVASGHQPRHHTFYPLTFFTARGEDVQHQNSTTFYNNAEVYEVVERVGELQKTWPKHWGPLDDCSIGVVSPYSDQVLRIRSELRKKKMFNVSVERVLNVQGKQFRAIFLSTVRTRHTCSADLALEEFVEYGFLSNVKLLNTAITRAQSLVAVIGDPVSLCSIGKCRKLWERFIEICHQHQSLHGITWGNLRAQLDGVELKKTYILNPLAPEFVPNRLRHASYAPPEPIAVGKYGYTFSSTGGGVPPPPHQMPGLHPGQQRGQMAGVHPGGWGAVPRQAPFFPNPHVPLLYQLMALPYSAPYPMLPPAALFAAGLPLAQQAPVPPSGPYSPQGRSGGAPLGPPPAMKLGSPHTQPRPSLQAKVKDTDVKEGSRVHSPSLTPKGALSSKAIDMSAATKAYQGTPLAPSQGMAFQPGSTPPGPGAGYNPRMITPATRQTMQPRYAQPPNMPYLYQGAAMPAAAARLSYLPTNPYLGAPVGGPPAVTGINHPRSAGLGVANTTISHSAGGHVLGGHDMGGGAGGLLASSVPSPPTVVTDRSPPNIQFLPTACNIKDPGGLQADNSTPSIHRAPRLQPQLQQPQQHQQHIDKPSLSDQQQQGLYGNPRLQWELYSYMQQTEGSHAAASYFNNLSSQTQPTHTMETPQRSSNQPPKQASNHTPSSLLYKRESVTVSVRLDDTPQASLQSSISGLSVDMSDLSDLSGRSSIQSDEKSRDNGSSPGSLGGGVQVQGSGFVTLMSAQPGSTAPYSLGMTPKEAKGTFFCSDLEQDLRRERGQSTGQGADTDPLSDLEKAGTVEHMMRFLDDSLDERPRQQQQQQSRQSTPMGQPSVGLLDFGAPADALPSLSLPPPPSSSQERPVPLYLRGSMSTPTSSSSTPSSSTPQPHLSYAGALRSSQPPSTTT